MTDFIDEKTGGKYADKVDQAQAQEIAVKVRGSWLAPVSIIEPNDADRRADALNAERLRVMDKARAAGLTDDEIRMLGDV